MKRKWFINLLAVGLCLYVGSLSAEQRVSGEVRGRWTRALSPWLVVGNITLRAQDSLIIEPGVTVRFTGNFRFDVAGVIWAVGAERDSIYIISDNAQPGSWRSIALSGLGARGSRFDFCVIQSAYRAIEATDSEIRIENSRLSNCDNAALRFVRSTGQAAKCIVGLINGTGIAVTGQSRPTIANCSIVQCGEYGIGVVENSIPILTNNKIIGARDCGIYLNAAGAVSIRENIIDLANTRGISIWESNNVQLYRNIVASTNGPGIWIYRCTGANLTNNNVIQSNQYGIYFSNSSAVVVNNIVMQSRSSGIFSDRSVLTMSYNDVWANLRGYEGVEAGFNDISADPQFTNPAEYDFHPLENSPVINAGDPGTPRDPDGTRADIGAMFRNLNHRPLITGWSPDTLVNVAGDSEVLFSVTAEDADGHGLRYTWFVNAVQSGEGREFRRRFNRDGDYIVRALVDDGFYEGTAEHQWQFTVLGSVIETELQPTDFAISRAYPNPFNRTTRLNISLPRPAELSLNIYDMRGRLVMNIFEGRIFSGFHRFAISSADLSSGEYILEANLDNSPNYRRIIVLK